MNKLFYACCTALFLGACSNDAPQDTNNPTTQDTVVTKIEEVPKDTIHRLKLSFIGDIMGHGDQIKTAAIDSKMDSFDYEPCFRFIKPLMEQADMAIGNLEVTLNDKKKYTGYPRFRSPDALAHYLKEAGFDFLATANNHSNDNDLHGVIHTLDVLDSLGFIHTGTFRDAEERTATYPLIVEKEADGTTFKLAFLNYTYGTNGIPTTAPSVVNLIEEEQILKDIEVAKQANPDMIIAFMHWGSEYKLDENSRQQKTTRMLWDNGVDLVIGAHPHVIEPIKTDTLYTKDSSRQREVLVAYSLGNFISNQLRPNTDIGLIFDIELVKNSASNKTIIGEHDYILAWRYIHDRSKSVYDRVHTILPVTAFEQDSTNFLKMPKDDLNKMRATAERMRTHLSKWQSKERKVTLEELVAAGVVSLTPKKEEVK